MRTVCEIYRSTKIHHAEKLYSHPSAQCHIITGIDTDTGHTVDILVSYSTPVAVWSDDTGSVKCDETYSATTRKHISWFMSEYTTGTYADARKSADNGGEWVEVA